MTITLQNGNLKIMVIDDSSTIRRSTEIFLQQASEIMPVGSISKVPVTQDWYLGLSSGDRLPPLSGLCQHGVGCGVPDYRFIQRAVSA